ncbi:YopX family protein [Lentilactobacillus otakiensis]|uniref:YopX family protein n=1 Tax=Lentilactobacillus otakiensis TaxID=481720 RepID=UPI001CC127C1|nr:YopX family protein [Lentilactobacillus otakiensis]MBZ3776472.1 YopX family protein [Lentilactobacillus otakiensis]
MSKEIKFRGYVEKIDDIGIDVPHEGHFLYGDLVHGNNFDYIVGGLIEATEEYAALEWWQTIQQGAAEQFTGLKDANGDDIYENDLVLLDPDDPPYQVIFDEGKFELSNDYLGLVYDLGEEHMDCEIVGNVHTNPELLEEEHD